MELIMGKGESDVVVLHKLKHGMKRKNMTLKTFLNHKFKYGIEHTMEHGTTK